MHFAPEFPIFRRLCAIVIFFLPLGAICDHIVLKNEDTISGSVVVWQDGSFEIKTALLGDVKAPWNAIAAIQADHPLTNWGGNVPSSQTPSLRGFSSYVSPEEIRAGRHGRACSFRGFFGKIP